uniref:Uncharacterized protein n=1 Tax=Magallana gigas TaxID=29159 RepID=A0A8W8JT41_MAGGI
MRTAILLCVAVGLVTLVASQNTACTTNAECDKSCGANMVGHCENNMCHCHAQNECVHADDCTCGGHQVATCDNHQCHCHHPRRAVHE